MVEIHKLIRAIRKEKKMTQKELAQKAGMPASDVCLFEQGKVNITIKRLQKVCDILDYDICLVKQAPTFVIVRKTK